MKRKRKPPLTIRQATRIAELEATLVKAEEMVAQRDAKIQQLHRCIRMVAKHSHEIRALITELAYERRLRIGSPDLLWRDP